MISYFILFFAATWLYPASRLTIHGRKNGLSLPFPVLPAVLLSLLIGLRYEVGGDWGNYLNYLYVAGQLSFTELIEKGDPAYQLLNLLSASLGLEVWFVNLLSGTIFTYGLVRFCNSLPDPRLAFIVSIPYLVVVVAMGYTRQGVALGLAMLAIPYLSQRKIFTYTFWIVLAATFHKSAIVLLPFAVLASTKNRWVLYPSILIIGYFAYQSLIAEALDSLIVNYIDAEYSSQGALIRVVMCVVPASIFLMFRKRFLLFGFERTFWTLMSLASFGAFVALFVIASSTAVDRLALYLIPIQLFVFSGLPSALSGRQDGGSSKAIWYGVVLYSFAVLTVWLFFAAHSHAWIPYKMYPLF